jgi:hypothetical protein
MMTRTTRRAFMAAVPAAAVVASVPAAALAMPTEGTDRRGWDAAMQAFQRLEAEDAAFEGPYQAAWQNCRAECEAVPHVTFPPEAYTGGRCQTTADQWALKRARRDVEQLDAGKMRLDPLPDLREHYDLKRQLVKAADERDAAIQAIRDRYDMDALDDRSDALGDQLADAAFALMALPAPDLAALRWKIDYTFGESYDPSYLAQMRADIARLMPEGA